MAPTPISVVVSPSTTTGGVMGGGGDDGGIDGVAKILVPPAPGTSDEMAAPLPPAVVGMYGHPATSGHEPSSGRSVAELLIA